MGFIMSILILVTFPIALVIVYRYLDRISNYETTRDKLLGIGVSIGISLLTTTLLTLIVMFFFYNVVT